MTRVAMVQLAVDATESVPDRVSRALALTADAATDADLVVLPEAWPAGAFDSALGVEHAQTLDGPLVAQLSEVAARTQTWLHGGSFIELAGDDEYFNTSVVFNPQGDLVGVYRKIHLFGFDAAEAALMTAGHEVVVIDTPLGRTGLATCYDLRFPELFRAMVDEGATAVLVASGWPSKRIARWTLLAAARSCENQLWFVGCNEVGTHGGTQLGGQSIITDPWGDVVVEGGTDEAIVVADIDPGFPDEVRAGFPVLQDRRL